MMLNIPPPYTNHARVIDWLQVWSHKQPMPTQIQTHWVATHAVTPGFSAQLSSITGLNYHLQSTMRPLPTDPAT